MQPHYPESHSALICGRPRSSPLLLCASLALLPPVHHRASSNLRSYFQKCWSRHTSKKSSPLATFTLYGAFNVPSLFLFLFLFFSHCPIGLSCFPFLKRLVQSRHNWTNAYNHQDTLISASTHHLQRKSGIHLTEYIYYSTKS